MTLWLIGLISISQVLLPKLSQRGGKHVDTPYCNALINRAFEVDGNRPARVEPARRAKLRPMSSFQLVLPEPMGLAFSIIAFSAGSPVFG